MTTCPLDEQLSRLLSEALSAAEHDAVVQHVNACPACQERLAGMTGSAATGSWQDSPERSPFGDSEDEVMRHLKSLPEWSASRSSNYLDTTISDRARTEREPSPDVVVAWPDVPGYEILGELGRGGMGVVFKARQLALQRVVAIKMLRNWTQAGEKEFARFRAEAEAIARLQHANIVQIYDVGDAGGRPYFVLEYVAGGNLAQRLTGTPQSPRLAAKFVEVLARAVDAAHGNGIVHRDLKPANILLTPTAPPESAAPDRTHLASPLAGDGGLAKAIPKIADFGVAKCASSDWEAELYRSLTVTGDVLGTPSYMAPEQASPKGPPVGPPADIYALGAILYELLTGRPPFKGETPLDTILQVLHGEPVPVTRLQPSVPRDLETICLKCLRKEPWHRYGSARDMADDLHSFLQGQPIQARPRGKAEKLWRWVREHPLSSALVAAGALTPILALLVLSFLSARLVRSSALDSAAQQAELLEHATNQYSLVVQRVEQAHYPINKMVPPTPDTVPLSIPATFMHDVGEALHQDSKTGIQVRQFSEEPFPWRVGGGPRDEFEWHALRSLQKSNGTESVHAFTEMSGEPVVRFAQARIMKQSCVDCHNTHPMSTRKDWKVGDVRGVLEIIRPLKNDEARVRQALRITLLLSAIGSGLLIVGSVLAVVARGRRVEDGLEERRVR